MNAKPKVILYIAMSLDGFIAGPNDDLSFLSMVEQPGEDYGYGEFMAGVDRVIMGRKTYDWVMQNMPGYSHADLETYIITRTARASVGKTNFYSGNLNELVTTLKANEGKNIFLDGGAEIVHELLKLKLIDECCISIIPVLLGDGVKLFKKGIAEQRLQLVQSQQFPSGLIQLYYTLLPSDSLLP